jgi:hypothetical protein
MHSRLLAAARQARDEGLLRASELDNILHALEAADG